ncbi:hypothetical protein ES703_04138 [subsurface metagenome]
MSITEEQRQEHIRLAASNEVIKTIASSLDLRQVYDTFTSQMKRLIAFDRAGVSLIEGDKVKVFASSVDEESKFAPGVEIPLKGTVAERIVANKKVYIAPDFAEERKYWTDDTLYREGMRSIIRLPLFSRGEVIGTFSVASRRPNAFGKKEQQILEEVTLLLAVAIEKAKAEEKLRAERDKLQGILSSLEEGVDVVGPDYRVYFQNQLLLDRFGDLRGKLCYEGYMGWSEPCESCPMVRAMQTNTTQSVEMVGTDGRHYEVTSTPFVDTDGEARAIEVVRDITERKQAEEALQRYAKRLEALHAVTQTVSQTLDMEQMLDIALDKVLEVMDLDGGLILLMDTEAGEMVLKAHRGVPEDFLGVMRRVEVSEADMQRWLEYRGPAFQMESIFDEATLAEMRTMTQEQWPESYFVTPLWSKEILRGGMGLGSRSKRRFSPEEVELLQAIGNQIAVGIENAQLLEKTRGLSVTDELTGLYNRRQFYEVLETEMYRTERYGASFSVAMLDIDGFKEYNDRFGHTSGDGVLKAVAQTLKSSLRKTDTAFRYGGDEFTIILPATDTDRAERVVDRVRSKWLKVPETENLVLETPLGLSAGIAQFPENAETADGLIFLTDTALYRSKMEGGNKTTLVSALGTFAPDVLSRATLDQVYALSATVDARDPFTYGHSKRVAAISEMIGKAIGLSSDKLATLHAAALLHDIGKVGVSDSILTKPDKPTKDEWKLIRKHSAEGARIVGYVKELAALVPIIRHHHEWYGGTGYPDGLRGEDIPLGARIISIADAYDTMTTPRTYRDVISQQEALEELRRCLGTQFDPELVEAFCRAIDEAARQD